MKELISELVANLINPKAAEKKKLDHKQELQLRFSKSLYLKEYLRTKAWLEFDRPRIYQTVESGIAKLLRDGPSMTDHDIRMTIANIRSSLNQVESMRYAIEVGEKAGAELERFK